MSFAPEASLPNVSAPNVSAPNVSAPNVSAPKASSLVGFIETMLKVLDEKGLDVALTHAELFSMAMPGSLKAVDETGQTKDVEGMEEGSFGVVFKNEGFLEAVESRDLKPAFKVRTLLAHGMFDAAENGDLEELKLIVESGRVEKYLDGVNVLQEAFFRAVAHNQIEACKYLISRGADVNAKSENGQTPLMVAASEKNIGVCELLLNRGADVNARYPDGRTVLWPAVGCTELFNLFLDHGADVRVRTNNGTTTLHPACSNRNRDVCMKLISLGVDVNARGICGDTPLHCACAGRRVDYGICKILLEHGADPSIKDSNGFTPMQMCNTSSLSEFFDLITHS